MAHASKAFDTWDAKSEPLEVTEARIHDGANTPADLIARARWYIDTLRDVFPHSAPQTGCSILEIGSGLGYIMQAAQERYKPSKIVGLDVAESMVTKAKRRLTRDGIEGMEFCLYDGIKVPIDSGTFDYIFSVAALQHVPKPFVYNLFWELKRLLKPGGYCAIHLLSVNNIEDHNKTVGYKKEIETQLLGEETHWHHFYSYDELLLTLADAVEAHDISVVDGVASIWVSFSNRGRVLHFDDMIYKTQMGLADRGWGEGRLQTYAGRTTT